MGLLQHKELLMCNEGLNRQIIMKNCAPIHRGTWCTAGVALPAQTFAWFCTPVSGVAAQYARLGLVAACDAYYRLVVLSKMSMLLSTSFSEAICS
jgi:hypothetical protein